MRISTIYIALVQIFGGIQKKLLRKFGWVSFANMTILSPGRSMQKFKIALIQMNVGPDRGKNLRKAARLGEKAAKRGAKIICFPELFSYMGRFTSPRRVAERVSGTTISLMRELAKECCIHIVAGSILEKTPRGLPLNTCFLIDPAGRIISRYSKLHPFDICVPGSIKFLESKYLRAGSCVTVADTVFGKIGFAICNDLRYPETFRKMVLAGARIVFIPSAFTKFTGRDHWVALNRVRAIENQCYIAAVNQSGENADGVKFFGSSVIIDPWGKILSEGSSAGDRIVIADIDLKLVDQTRKHLPALKKIRSRYPLKIQR